MTTETPSFKQQNLPAWQPILTAGTVLPTFFLIGVAFVPIGIGLLMASSSVQEKIVDYTDCKSLEQPDKTCAWILQTAASVSSKRCTCVERFTLEHDFEPHVFVYYGLSNFYQNHRRYVKSRDDYQLQGNPRSVGSDCKPFDFKHAGEAGQQPIPIAPCGAIANSMFNDTFNLNISKMSGNDRPITIELSKQGIAWPTDKFSKFRNPPGANLTLAFNGTAKPNNWQRPVYDLVRGDRDNNGFQNEDLIIWMRTAALPTFRKLFGIVQLDRLGTKRLPRGEYSVQINYNYPVAVFHGRKRFIISTTSWLGGKNNFLGIAYIVVGCACFILSAMFLFIHKKYGRLPAEMTQINQTTPYLTT